MTIHRVKKLIFIYRYILLILGLAFLLRVIGITKSPPSLYWEEAALGYDAYAILKTGKDFHGNSWPIVAFESFGDWKPALYFYLIVPLIPILGLSEVAIRLPSILAGTLSVGLVYLIALQLRLSRRTAMASAMMLAIMPWHLQFSRAGFEVTVAVLLMLSGIWLILFSRQKPARMVLATMSLVLSMYTYHGLRLLAPLVGIVTVLFFIDRFWTQRWIYLAGLISFFLILPLLINLNSPQVRQRINETSLFSVSQAVVDTNQWRAEDGNSTLSRVVHHRYWYWLKEIIAGVTDHFTLNFLFINGDGNQRHQTGYFALLYHWMIIPLLAGWYSMYWKKKQLFWYLSTMIVISALPSAMTNSTPHTLRFLPAAPFMALLIGYGVIVVYKWIISLQWSGLKKVVLILALLIILGEWVAYGYDYFRVYPKRASQDWQYGYRQLMEYLEPMRNKYDQIVITRNEGRPSIYNWFYWQEDPLLVQAADPKVPQDQGEYLGYDNIVYGEQELSTNTLIVTTQPKDNLQLLRQINYLNGDTAFYVYEY